MFRELLSKLLRKCVVSINICTYFLKIRPYFDNASRFYHTVKHLKLKQIIWRVWYKIYKMKAVSSHILKTEVATKKWIEHARRRPSLVSDMTFEFFGETGNIREIGWDGPCRSKLWRYNQHYFDDLNAMNSSNRIDWHNNLINNWILENKIGAGSGWEPYPTSLRIINWIKFAITTQDLGSGVNASLLMQARWLSRHIEWHILGNHLFSNAKALYFCGLYFQGAEAEEWRKKGLKILHIELREQVLPDGGHFELSPMYHALAVEDFLDLVNVANCYDRADDVQQLKEALPGMLAWLSLMSHPDGKISFFNDSALNISPNNHQIFEYAERLGINQSNVSENCVLGESGYFRLQTSNSVLLGDVGKIGPDYLPSHAHADTLSFEFSLFGQRLIVNSGTSEYGSGPERLRQRGTFAHSTVSINGVNSSDVWSGFRVGRRARPGKIKYQIFDDQAFVEGSHDGYSVQPGSPIHFRKWFLRSGSLNIRDTIVCSSSYEVNIIFRLHPVVVVSRDKTDSIVLTLPLGNTATLAYSNDLTVSINDTTWHPMFGKVQDSQMLCFSKQCNYKSKFYFNLTWME